MAATLFESYERRIDHINEVLAKYGINGIEEAKAICDAKGIDPYKMCEETQPICFENAKWAYVVGAAIAIKKGCTDAADAAEAIGEGLQAFCIAGSVADDRKVGLGHGNLAARLLREETQCFAFLAGHESFAAAEGAIKIAEMANRVRKNPLRVILNGLGKDAAKIISRINGFTYVQTQFDYYTGEVKVVDTIAYSDGLRSKVRCSAPRCRHLQEGASARRQEVLLGSFGRRHGPYPPPRQHGRRSRFVRYDRHHGPYALGCSVRRFVIGSGTRRDDGLPRHGQQPDGRRYRGRSRGRTAGYEQIIRRYPAIVPAACAGRGDFLFHICSAADTPLSLHAITCVTPMPYRKRTK